MTADAVVEIKPPKQEFAFASKAIELLVILEGSKRVDIGGVSEVVRGKEAQFRLKHFRADEETARRMGYGSAEELAAALRGHHQFDELFFELHVEPEAPDPAAALDAVTRLTVAGDVDALVSMYDAERENWKRPQVLNAIHRSVRALDGEGTEEVPEDQGPVEAPPIHTDAHVSGPVVDPDDPNTDFEPGNAGLKNPF
jgi:hypothetical protein